MNLEGTEHREVLWAAVAGELESILDKTIMSNATDDAGPKRAAPDSAHEAGSIVRQVGTEPALSFPLDHTAPRHAPCIPVAGFSRIFKDESKDLTM